MSLVVSDSGPGGRRALGASRNIAALAVVVDAKDDNAHRFYSEFGFTSFPETTNRLFTRMETIEQLFQSMALPSAKAEKG